MEITGVSGTRAVFPFWGVQFAGNQRGGQDLSSAFALTCDGKQAEINDKSGVSENSVKLWNLGKNRWEQLLQICHKDMIQIEGNTDILDNIRNAGEDAGMLSVQSLVAEKTYCVFPVDEDKVITYYTFYDKDRIYCKREGTEDCEWEIPLEDASQYDRVVAFLDGLEERDNQSFTVRNAFWQDFLSGKLDAEAFQDFLTTRQQEGIPVSPVLTENGVVSDQEAVKYSVYTAGLEFGATIIRTTEEFLAWQEKQCDKVFDEVEKEGLVNGYNKKHLAEIGKMSRFYNRRWMTMAEYHALWQNEPAGLFSQGL